VRITGSIDLSNPNTPPVVVDDDDEGIIKSRK